MIFSSPTFLFVFLPIFILLYYFLPWKNSILLIASMIFYSWGEPVYVLLMLAVIYSNFMFGKFVDASEGRKEKFWLAACIAFNVTVLVFFKYSGFIVENINAILVNLSISPIEFNEPHLPLGISFFIFQAITYVVDIYRRHATVEQSPYNVALYISMFPQLVAGPIVRFEEISKAIHHRVTSISHVVSGIERFVKGLAKKVLIADPLSVPVDLIFSAPASSLPPETAWFGILCFSLQIFFDFSAYSDMAIGLGRAMGFKFPENFNYPYRSRSLQEFWRRWHMTLSRWFRDYVYIPLGGNRVSMARVYVNLIAVFILTGFWHGASWTFLIWGLFHGLFMLMERVGLKDLLDRMPRILQHSYLLLVIIISWVFFRADDLPHALHYIKAMFVPDAVDYAHYSLMNYISPYMVAVFLIGAFIAVNPLKVYRYRIIKGFVRDRFGIEPHTSASILSGAQLAIYAVLLLLSLSAVATQTHQAFIYFRF